MGFSVSRGYTRKGIPSSSSPSLEIDGRGSSFRLAPPSICWPSQRPLWHALYRHSRSTRGFPALYLRCRPLLLKLGSFQHTHVGHAASPIWLWGRGLHLSPFPGPPCSEGPRLQSVETATAVGSRHFPAPASLAPSLAAAAVAS